MAISQDIPIQNIPPRIDGVDSKSSKGRGVGRFLSAKTPHEDLFQKYILDKESEVVTGEQNILEEQALSRNGTETNGFLSSREQKAVEKSVTRKSSGPKLPPQSKNPGHGKGRAVPAQARVVDNQQPISESKLKTTAKAQDANKVSRSGGEFRPGDPVVRKSFVVRNQPQKHIELKPVPQAQARMVQTEANAKPQVSRPQVSKDRSEIVQHGSKAALGSQVEASSSVRPSAQSESFAGHHDGQGTRDGHQEQHPSERQGSVPVPDVIPQTASDNVQQLNNQAGSAHGTNLNGQTNAYGGVISQIAQQLMRMRESSGPTTTRVTLDLPDGEKLLVRFHMRKDQGMQVQFSTKSRGLKNALEQYWDGLKVEAGQRGIELDEPLFEGISEESSNEAVFLERTTPQAHPR